MNRINRNGTAGFTITELLVVLSLSAIMLGAVLPAMSVVRRMTTGNVAPRMIATTVTTARAYSTVSHADLDNSGNPAYTGFSFSGAAVLFTPAGEMRLVENDQNALNADTPSEMLEVSNLNGYRDIPGVDYINLPDDAGVVGIARGNSGRYLLTPPFAIRFNDSGHLIAGVDGSHRAVYYDGDYDGTFEVSTQRTTSYNMDSWDPTSPTYSSSAWDATAQKHIVPFEQIETAIGVIVYSKKAFREDGEDHSIDTLSSVNTDAETWILANGQTMLFSRYTGSAIGQ